MANNVELLRDAAQWGGPMRAHVARMLCDTRIYARMQNATCSHLSLTVFDSVPPIGRWQVEDGGMPADKGAQ
jgi:hypothetical protein